MTTIWEDMVTVWFGLIAVVVADTAEIGYKFRSCHSRAEAGGVQAALFLRSSRLDGRVWCIRDEWARF